MLSSGLSKATVNNWCINTKYFVENIRSKQINNLIETASVCLVSICFSSLFFFSVIDKSRPSAFCVDSRFCIRKNSNVIHRVSPDLDKIYSSLNVMRKDKTSVFIYMYILLYNNNNHVTLLILVPYRLC